jgi:hypothetical protein
MKDSIILALCCLVSFDFSAVRLRSQPQDKNPNAWVDVLRDDARLKLAVSYNFVARPTPEELFASIQKATGVTLSMAAQTEKGKLTFGTTQAFKVPAWKLMEIVREVCR